jgi:hypothetical protein
VRKKKPGFRCRDHALLAAAASLGTRVGGDASVARGERIEPGQMKKKIEKIQIRILALGLWRGTASPMTPHVWERVRGLGGSIYMLCTTCGSLGALRLNSIELDRKMVKTHPGSGH